MSSALLAKRPLVEPDYWTCPHGVRVRPTATYGPAVAELCEKAGFTPDAQQELGLDLVFAIRSDGSPASFSFCVICARQNLKSGLFLQCVIGWLFVVDVPEIAWSAHELKTSLDAQENLFAILESPALSKYLPVNQNAGKYDTNGKERQELTTGQTVWFQTRTRDGGRGLGKPKVIIDEAFKFKKRTAGALLPIMLAQHHPQLLYGSSEPPADPDAEVLLDVIERGQKRMSPEMSFLQWMAQREDCADPECRHPKNALELGLDCALDREHLLLQANPTVHRDDDGRALDTGRITMRTLRNLRQELPPEEYMRECLGWADESKSTKGTAVNLARWNALGDPQTPPPTRASVVIHVAPDRSRTTIGVAGDGVDGKTVLLEHTLPGTQGVVAKVQALKVDVVEVALHPSGQAGALGPALKAAGIEYHSLTHRDFARGCSTMLNGIDIGTLTHRRQKDLDAAVAIARTRHVDQAEVWDNRNPELDVTPVVAVSAAAHRWEVIRAATPPPPPEAIADVSADPPSDFVTDAPDWNSIPL